MAVASSSVRGPGPPGEWDGYTAGRREAGGRAQAAMTIESDKCSTAPSTGLISSSPASFSPASLRRRRSNTLRTRALCSSLLRDGVASFMTLMRTVSKAACGSGVAPASLGSGLEAFMLCVNVVSSPRWAKGDACSPWSAKVFNLQ